LSTPHFSGPDGRSVIVAIDHTLYSWPCAGLEDRRRILGAVAGAGADAIIASYGTIRDFRADFGQAEPILKLDITNLTLGTNYAVTEYVMAYTLEDAARLGVRSVLTYIQLGAPFELEALRAAARLSAQCDREGFTYLCEIMPVESPAYPDPAAPDAIVAACRTGQELGAHAIKTTMPVPAEAIGEAVSACAIPVILAGGAPASDREQYLDAIAAAIGAGAAGVAVGRNVWGAPDPAAIVSRLAGIVHGQRRAAA
jgi:fructose-bisphosphate aldolase / 2-amino-3,7-dideoxy-D-threo-hept-6-ulosonate synthase